MGQNASSSSSISPSALGLGSCMSSEKDFTSILPDECLASIFSKLSSQDRNSCSLVCRRWNLVDSHFRAHLILAARFDLSSILPFLLSRFELLSALSLKCSRKCTSIDDASFASISRSLPLLKKLKIKGCTNVTDAGLEAFASFCINTPLFKLSLASCSFGSVGINSVLTHCTQLRDLTLKRLRKLDTENNALGFDTKEINLDRLCLKDLHNARIFGPILRSCKQLKTLIVCRSSGMWDPVLENLQNRVLEIHMENVQMGDMGLVAISSSCRDLDVLHLSRVTDCTDDGFLVLASSCKKLRKLHIDISSRLGNRLIGDHSILAIAASCSLIQEIVLMGVSASSFSLESLGLNCHGLERMAFCNMDSIRDPELELIALKFSSLRKLCIKNCPISDLGIHNLANGCPNLVKLKVKRCRGVTQVGICSLKMKRMSMIISIDAVSLSGGEIIVGEDEEEEREGNGRRRITSSSSTHVVCGSRGASLLRSKLTLALLRPNCSAPFCSSSSSHVAN